MGLHAMWVHGNSAQIELNSWGRGAREDVVPGSVNTYPFGRIGASIQWSGVVGLRTGAGAEYQCQEGSDYWFHFAVATPVIVEDTRARLRRVMVLFTAQRGVTLAAVHVWDGPTRVFTRDGLSVGGVNTGLADGTNSFALPDRTVSWALGVSTRFRFASENRLQLHAAGIDLEV